jgi:hypothetical protein
MGVELGDKILIEDGHGGIAEVIVDSGGLLNKAGNPIQTIMPLLRGAESFEKVPWEPKDDEAYYYPLFSAYNWWSSSVWRNRPVDYQIKKTVGIYRTEEEALQKARELGWVE